MFKSILNRKGIKLCYTIPFVSKLWINDNTEKLTPTELKADRSHAQNQTGWDRLRRVFQVDEFGNLSQEATSLIQCMCLSGMVGVIYGGTMESKKAYTNFMQNNQATSFKSHLDAKRKLQDAVTIAFGKGAYRFSWRLILFTTSFVGISTLIQTYTGKTSIKEYVAAGGLTGFMYKFNMGPKAWLIGGGVGSVLGLICGSTSLLLLKLAGISLEETRYWQYQWRETQNEFLEKAKSRSFVEKDFAIVRLHEEKTKNTANTLEPLDKENASDGVKNKTSQ